MVTFPCAREGDADDVSMALEVARSLWARGDRDEALKWLRKAVDGAFNVDDDKRGMELLKVAADLSSRSTEEVPGAQLPQYPEYPLYGEHEEQVEYEEPGEYGVQGAHGNEDEYPVYPEYDEYQGQDDYPIHLDHLEYSAPETPKQVRAPSPGVSMADPIPVKTMLGHSPVYRSQSEKRILPPEPIVQQDSPYDFFPRQREPEPVPKPQKVMTVGGHDEVQRSATRVEPRRHGSKPFVPKLRENRAEREELAQVEQAPVIPPPVLLSGRKLAGRTNLIAQSPDAMAKSNVDPPGSLGTPDPAEIPTNIEHAVASGGTSVKGTKGAKSPMRAMGAKGQMGTKSLMSPKDTKGPTGTVVAAGAKSPVATKGAKGPIGVMGTGEPTEVEGVWGRSGSSPGDLDGGVPMVVDDELLGSSPHPAATSMDRSMDKNMGKNMPKKPKPVDKLVVPTMQSVRVAAGADKGGVYVRLLDVDGLRDGECDAMLVALTVDGDLTSLFGQET